MPSDRAKPRPIAAFTLLELFVVLVLILVIVGFLFAYLLPARRSAVDEARRAQSKNNLKQISLALENYAAAHGGSFPPACTVDSNGKPLHSWRTLLLPYLGRAPIYKSIDLSKPWNDPANANAFNACVATYRFPSADCPKNHTTYLAIVGPTSCFPPAGSRNVSEITDPAGETMLVIEVHWKHSVPWMSPTDDDEELLLAFSPKTGLPHAGGPYAAFVDGRIRQVSAGMPGEARRARISVAGNDNDPNDEW